VLLLTFHKDSKAKRQRFPFARKSYQQPQGVTQQDIKKDEGNDMKNLLFLCILAAALGTIAGCASEVRPWSFNDVEMIRDMYFDEELIQLRKEVKEVK
jgi:hypothetical protein